MRLSQWKLQGRSPWVLGALIGFGLSVGFAGLVASQDGRRWLHRIDKVWFGERLMDTMARLRTAEDWSAAPPLAGPQDYAWLEAAGSPVRIAHALGDAGTPTANTLGAARRAYDAGFRLLEVDLVERGGALHCQHDLVRPRDQMDDGCTFERLIAELPSDALLVLDIKTRFAAVGQRIVDQVKGKSTARQIVFQLYRPGDFELFNAWQAQAALPGPILTTYLAHRRIEHVAKEARRIGVRAFALPIERLPSLRAPPLNAVVLVHPVHDCQAWKESMGRAGGGYIVSGLACSPMSPAENARHEL